MDTLQAREHLGAIDEILQRAERGSPPAFQFIIWGIVGIAFDVVGQLVSLGKVGPSAFGVAGSILALAIVASAWDGIRMRSIAGRQSTIGRLAGLSFWAAAAVMTVVTVMNEFTNLFPTFAPAVFYAAGMCVVLLALGFGLRTRALILGGLALLASLIIAFLMPNWLGAILAVGNFAGFVLPGISFALAKSNG